MDICGTTAFMIARDGGRKDVVKLLQDFSEDRNIVLNPKDKYFRWVRRQENDEKLNHFCY